MDWKRLNEGDLAACSHPGGTHFFQVEAGSVTWWSLIPPRVVAPPGAVRCRCRDRRCAKVFWAVTVPAEQAHRPPQVAA